MAIKTDSGYGGRAPKKKKKEDPVRAAAKQLFAYYSPQGYPQPKGLMKMATNALRDIPKPVVSQLLARRAKIVFLNPREVQKGRGKPVPEEIQRLYGGEFPGGFGDLGTFYLTPAGAPSGRPLLFISRDMSKGFKQRGANFVLRHEVGHFTSEVHYLRAMLGRLYLGVERKSPRMMPAQSRALEERQSQSVADPNRWGVTLGRSDARFPSDKVDWDYSMDTNQTPETMPRQWTDEEKFADAFAYYTDPRWKKTLHKDVQKYFADLFGD